MAKYLKGKIVGWRKLDSRYVDGRKWLLLNPRGAFHFVAEDGRKLTPPHLFIHDFNSIPRPLWALWPPAGGGSEDTRTGPAAVCHDWSYEHSHWDDGTPFTRKTADQIHRAINKCMGVRKSQYRMMYRALRIGGGPHYWKHHKRGDHHG